MHIKLRRAYAEGNLHARSMLSILPLLARFFLLAPQLQVYVSIVADIRSLEPRWDAYQVASGLC